ncbi:hypothetical protein DFH07DRAFT_853529 [Mycena maculata]|uniref:SEC7 domain-containing protein n=1 Tax=Mycena maculata TaxID=230809 RepID=A0AAD7HQF9_9AGAR|nr:hypothetical protein DFH07DRAFT_853529 [Mycena maculata]
MAVFRQGRSTLDVGDGVGLQRRVSRTDLDFEAALLQDGTFRLQEGLDVNKLGVESPSPRRTSGTPGTPTVIPATPTPVAGPSRVSGSSPSGSSSEQYYDAEDTDRAAARRSMYRSPGTSSSPDLATLLRKAKERGGVVSPKNRDRRRPDDPPPPPMPNQITSIAYASSPKGKNKLQRSTTNGEDKDKPPKSSVRAKTSAFLGKMLGQGTVRERSKTDAGSYTAPGFYNAPPVPPLPAQVHRTPIGSPIADVFSSTSTRPDLSGKPLPPIHSPDDDDTSMVFVENIPRTPSPTKRLDPPPTRQRRSMSVGEVELKRIAATATAPRHDPALTGILTDFQGQLDQLAPTLDLKDPSTPARRAAYSTRSKTDPTPAAPLLTLQLPQSEDEDAPPSPIAPPRTTSLQMRASPRGVPARHGSSPLRTRSGNSFVSPTSNGSGHLRILHGSSASVSEPSLVPAGEDNTRVCEPLHLLRLVSPPSSPSAVPGVYRTSQQDLSVHDLTLTRTPSHSPARGEDPEDMEARSKELATRCWKEDEDFLGKEKIAEWLGGVGPVNKVALHHYLNFFDFSGLRLDLAFRRLCAKLYLKAETQQVDRILEEFSRRYWECNPGGLYGSANLVHAVSYSLLLLNTDLHVADLQTRMSRTQFVRNTLTAIQMQLQPTPAQSSMTDLTHDSGSVRVETPESTPGRSKRSDSITSWHSVSREAVLPGTPYVSSPPANGSTPSVQTPAPGHEHRSSVSSVVYSRGWESDMENLLKEMYNAVKSQQILQPLNSSRSSMGSLSPGPPTMLRNRSQRGPPDRLATLKRGSIRGLQSILGAQQTASPYSSNSSIDGRTSPSPSFATSTHETLYNSSSSFLTPTLGFASNLSHTIIREAQEDDDRSVHSEDSSTSNISISDEELALLGAPWAKEGMLCRKQYWESVGRRARDKAWLDVFVVIQKGELNMFTFGENNPGATGTFGGGNWLSNANAVGTVQLAHSLAHALPSPGYNRQRPYCMVLTLANGGVYFFQAGTEELVNEWVSTCNYWAARTSKEPLAGGVSNMEYGWNRLDTSGHTRAHSETETATDYSDMMSVRSGRSGRSKFGWRDGAATVRGTSSPWADRTVVNDWKPPLPPTMSSPHDEEAQLEALRKHVASMKRDLKQHNEYREPMAALYQPRSANAIKAQSNWEKKSQYLLTEIVKYDSYIDSLQAAMSLRLKKRGEKALERALNGNAADDAGGKGKWKGPEEATIDEDEEPLTPANKGFGTQLHRRETADAGEED